MATARHRLAHNLLASLAILGAVAAIAVGLPALDRALPADRPVRAGVPYPVGAGVTVVPPPAAMLDVTKTRPGPDGGTALFVLDTIRYAIVVGPFSGTLDAAAERLRRKIAENRGYQITGAERPVTTAQGVHGRQGGYTAPGRAGRYAVFVVDELAIEVTVSGAAPGYDRAFDQIAHSVKSAASGEEAQ